MTDKVKTELEAKMTTELEAKMTTELEAAKELIRYRHMVENLLVPEMSVGMRWLAIFLGFAFGVFGFLGCIGNRHAGKWAMWTLLGIGLQVGFWVLLFSGILAGAMITAHH